MASRTKEVREILRGSRFVLPDSKRLSSGSKMLNLACTGDASYAFLTRHYYWLVGSSDSGKSFLSMTCFAEAAKNPEFDDYQFIVDLPEGGVMMDIPRFFGQKVADRIRPPEVDEEGRPVHSDTGESFYFHADDAFRKPTIYLLDSHDALSSVSEVTKFDQLKKAHQKGKMQEATGSFGDGKAKLNSANLRKVIQSLERSNSILIIISQERDSFNMFQPSTAAGGRALKFYATLQMWSSQAGEIKKTVMGKERQLGIYAKFAVKKSRVIGRHRSVRIPIYHSYGIDDIGGMVDYLVGEGYWKKADGATKIAVRGFGPEFSMDRDSLIAKIEEDGLEEDLVTIVQEVWDKIEEACEIKRKPRYE